MNEFLLRRIKIKMKKFFMTMTFLIALTLPVSGASIPLPDKSGDKVLQSMIDETLPKFQMMTYKEKNFELPCNIYLPEDYPGDRSYPLVVFIADGSVVGKAPEAPLTQGYGGIIWATDDAQAKHKCIVAVPQYPKLILDDQGSYTITDYINLASRIPDLFAAEIFVSGQWDVRQLNGLKSQKFFYITAEGDQRANIGQRALMKSFKESHVPFSNADTWDAKMSQEDYTKAMNTILMGNSLAHFIQFRLGTVLDPGLPVGTPEHMFSFDYAYKIDALREWLFRQNRKDKRAK